MNTILKHSKRLWGFAVILCVVGAGAAFISTGTTRADSNEERRTADVAATEAIVTPLDKEEVVILKQDGEQLYFNIELALTPKQKAQGLMYRTEMPENEGMLFLFNGVTKAAFWMKNTLIPLDMLFLHPDGRIHHIHHNARPQDLTRITSEYPAKAVLELNGGASDRMGIKEGDQILHRFFNNEHLKENH